MRIAEQLAGVEPGSLSHFGEFRPAPVTLPANVRAASGQLGHPRHQVAVLIRVGPPDQELGCTRGRLVQHGQHPVPVPARIGQPLQHQHHRRVSRRPLHSQLPLCRLVHHLVRQVHRTHYHRVRLAHAQRPGPDLQRHDPRGLFRAHREAGPSQVELRVDPVGDHVRHGAHHARRRQRPGEPVPDAARPPPRRPRRPPPTPRPASGPRTVRPRDRTPFRSAPRSGPAAALVRLRPPWPLPAPAPAGSASPPDPAAGTAARPASPRPARRRPAGPCRSAPRHGSPRCPHRPRGPPPRPRRPRTCPRPASRQCDRPRQGPAAAPGSPVRPGWLNRPRRPRPGVRCSRRTRTRSPPPAVARPRARRRAARAAASHRAPRSARPRRASAAAPRRSAHQAP